VGACSTSASAQPRSSFWVTINSPGLDATSPCSASSSVVTMKASRGLLWAMA
jgi:hypothetical protein